MKVIVFIFISIFPLYSQWEAGVGYSLSKETFENSEWRIYEGELQVHRNDSSYFYDLNNLKLNDKLKVVDDTLKTIREFSGSEVFNILDSKFDKVNYKIIGNYLNIFDEKSSNELFKFNFNDTLKKYLAVEGDLFFGYENYYIFRSNNKLFIINNNTYLQLVTTRSQFTEQVTKMFILIYNISNNTFEVKSFNSIKNLIDYRINQIKLKNIEYPTFYISTEHGSFDWFSDYTIYRREFLKFDTKDNSISTMLLNTTYNKSITNISKNEEYNIEYNNYTFNSREIKNWENQNIDTNIRIYKARLIQEVIPNTYLMFSDSINYFIYNLIDKNIVVMDKLNNIHKKEQFSNEYVDEVKNLFYAETASHKIARISISSIINNLISVDFSADKNMADSNYVFTFENKSVGNIDEYFWDFGDGNTSTEKSPKHKYENSGTYDITLTCSGNGQTTSNTKKGQIYIPTPVKLNVSHTMTINENDATIYVTNGASGSNLKHRIITSPFNVLRNNQPLTSIDTLQGKSYLFTTNKSYFSRYFLFEVWNEMYSAYQYYNINNIEFDFWNKDLVEEKIIENNNSKIKLNNKETEYFLIHNGNNSPITVVSENSIIQVDNLINNVKFFEINKEKAIHSEYSFITVDNFLYYFILKDNINQIDSVDINPLISNDNIESYGVQDATHYLLTSSSYVYIIDVYGNLINKYIKPVIKQTNKNNESKDVNVFNYYKPYKYKYNNKIVELKDTIYQDIYSGNVQHIYTNLSIKDLINTEILYNYTFNERMGFFKSAIFSNENLYLYGFTWKGERFYKTLLKLDLKDELFLNLNYKDYTNFLIHPNPAKNKLNIVTDEIVSNIKIIDLLGRVVYQSNSNSKEIDISTLNTGVYNLILNHEQSLKFIKE